MSANSRDNLLFYTALTITALIMLTLGTCGGKYAYKSPFYAHVYDDKYMEVYSPKFIAYFGESSVDSITQELLSSGWEYLPCEAKPNNTAVGYIDTCAIDIKQIKAAY